MTVMGASHNHIQYAIRRKGHVLTPNGEKWWYCPAENTLDIGSFQSADCHSGRWGCPKHTTTVLQTKESDKQKRIFVGFVELYLDKPQDALKISEELQMQFVTYYSSCLFRIAFTLSTACSLSCFPSIFIPDCTGTTYVDQAGEMALDCLYSIL